METVTRKNLKKWKNLRDSSQTKRKKKKTRVKTKKTSKVRRVKGDTKKKQIYHEKNAKNGDCCEIFVGEESRKR